MAKWNKITQYLGEVAEKSKHKVVFKTEDKLDIQELTSGCGCTTPFYNKELNQIEATYKADSIPYHLQSQGYKNINVPITIKYKDGTTDVLKVTGVIVKK